MAASFGSSRLTRSLPNNYNYVYMTSGLRDLQNTPFAGTNFYFYAGAEPDDTAPVVTAVSPPEGAANVGISATIRLYVNESVNPVSVSPSTVTLASSAGVIPASVTFNTTNTIVTLVPQVPLPASTALTLTIAGVQDRAANATAPQTVHFTTGAAADTVQPSVIATNVTASGAANVPVNSVFQLTFDEPMDATTVLSQTPTFIYDSSAGYVSGVGSMSSDGLVYTFVPDGPLAVSRQHGLSMYLGTDLAGNPQHAFSFYFSTAFTEDTTPPAVVLVNPAAGSTGVPRNARVEVRFSEPVNATSIGNVRLLRNGQNIGVTRTLSDSNRTLTLRPTTILLSNASFTISVAGVRDTRGNVMPATVTSTFSTGSRTDLVVPTILSTNPDSEDSGVGVNMSGRLIFSETIDPLSVTSDTFRIANVGGGPYLEATVSVAADRRSATLVPSAPLLALHALLPVPAELYRRRWQYRQRHDRLLLHRRRSGHHGPDRRGIVPTDRCAGAAGQYSNHHRDERGHRSHVTVECVDSAHASSGRHGGARGGSRHVDVHAVGESLAIHGVQRSRERPARHRRQHDVGGGVRLHDRSVRHTGHDGAHDHRPHADRERRRRRRYVAPDDQHERADHGGRGWPELGARLRRHSKRGDVSSSPASIPSTRQGP